jgi:hypothetical protein
MTVSSCDRVLDSGICCHHVRIPIGADPIVAAAPGRLLVGHFINTVTYSVVLFRVDFVARSSRITADMLLALASSARIIPRRLRHRIYETAHLVSFVCFCAVPAPSRRDAGKEQKQTEETKVFHTPADVSSTPWLQPLSRRGPEVHGYLHCTATRCLLLTPGRLKCPNSRPAAPVRARGLEAVYQPCPGPQALINRPSPGAFIDAPVA